jgi:hypothetical protein
MARYILDGIFIAFAAIFMGLTVAAFAWLALIVSRWMDDLRG